MVPSNNIINIRFANDRIFIGHRIIMEYLLFSVKAPIVINLINIGIGLFITKNQGNTYGVGFSAIGFVSKTAGMVFLTWLGVSYMIGFQNIYSTINIFLVYYPHFGSIYN